MVRKRYLWSDGAELEEHSKRKLKILREYFARYLTVRCRLPMQTRFRLAIVEGFCGGGRYKCGTPGSPIVFVEELINATKSLEIKRAAEGMAPLTIECLLILNDAEPDAIACLKTHMQPLLASAKADVPKLFLHVEYRQKRFEEVYPEIKQLIASAGCQNVLFTLDQCGHSLVERATLVDILRSYASAEIFYTFMVTSLIAFLKKADPIALRLQLRALGLSEQELATLQEGMNKSMWLGAAERLVFNAFKNCAAFVSPFSINNADGWRYWLIHFSNAYRGRQVYNDLLHQNSTAQAHFGRSGLHMLHYNVEDDHNRLYLFDVDGRHAAKAQLMEDIPRLVSEFGDAVPVGTFYETIYNMTPSHADDVHNAIIENSDLEVITESGGARRVANTIRVEDVLRIKRQRSLFPMSNPDRGKK